MSTIKVTNIEHGSTTNGGIQLDNAGHVTVDGQQMPTAGALSSRRININGAMQVSQRTTSKSGLSSSNAVQVVDRMFIRINGAGTFTVSQSTESPDGFSNSIKWDCTTADSSPGASDFAYMGYKMEGRDLQHLKKGTSSALKTTVSFWVRSSETGTYAFRLVDHDNSRQVGLNYTINTADTWEHKTLTLPGDTSGALDNNSANSMSLFWWLVVGSNRTSGSLPTAWEATTTADEAAGMTANIAASTSSDFYLTGLQFEVGEKATPFEHKSYGEELHRCKRYYQELDLGTNNNVLHMVFSRFGASNGNAFAYFPFPTAMRAAPSFSFLGETFNSSGYTGNPSLGAATINGAQLNSANSFNAGANAYLRPNNDSGDFLRLTFNSEL
jgi:hypothetical protein